MQKILKKLINFAKEIKKLIIVTRGEKGLNNFSLFLVKKLLKLKQEKI